ncbi:MAG: hypothetical protein KTR24_00885, partial [Saprospiraceae bacterium]|nr:hypothetical protein [Saprospiraceae bacterium]
MITWPTLLPFFMLLLAFTSLGSCQEPSTTPAEARVPDTTLVYDLLIMDGLLIDGSGMTGRYDAILVSGDSIAYVGPLDTAKIDYRRHLDARQNVVTPGFIDLHAHGDPMQSSSFINFLNMGVTTVVLGQDGSSPLSKNPEDYFGQLEGLPLLTNIAMMAGHGTLRKLADAAINAPANSEDLNQMQQMLSKMMVAGCYGMSSGLEYVPGMWADSTEMVSLAQVIGEHEGVLMSHIRSEDEDQIDASITELGWNAPFCRTHVSHLKVTYGKNVGQGAEVLTKINQFASLAGFPMTAEVYPYMASYTGIGIVFPPWAKTPSAFEAAKATRYEELRTFLKDKVMQRNGPE